MGRSDFKLTRQFLPPTHLEKELDWSYTFAETSTRRLQQILKFLGEQNKHKRPVFLTQESDLAQNWTEDLTLR